MYCCNNKNTNWCITEIDYHYNLIYGWITSPALMNKRGLQIVAEYKDTTNIITENIDFFKNSPRKKIPNKSRLELMLYEEQKESMGIDQYLSLICSNPISEIDPSKITIYNTKDTSEKYTLNKYERDKHSQRIINIKYTWKKNTNYRIVIGKNALKDIYNNYNRVTAFNFKTQQLSMQKITNRIDAQIIADTIVPRKYTVNAKLDEGKTYRVFIPKGCINGFYTLNNDSTGFDFDIKKSESFGSLTFAVQNAPKPSFIQLCDKKNKIIAEAVLGNNNEVFFQYLNPGDYIIRLICDSNGNNDWDTGSYFDKRLPEKIIYYDETIKIKSNWDNKIVWDIKK